MPYFPLSIGTRDQDCDQQRNERFPDSPPGNLAEFLRWKVGRNPGVRANCRQDNDHNDDQTGSQAAPVQDRSAANTIDNSRDQTGKADEQKMTHKPRERTPAGTGRCVQATKCACELSEYRGLHRLRRNVLDREDRVGRGQIAVPVQWLAVGLA